MSNIQQPTAVPAVTENPVVNNILGKHADIIDKLKTLSGADIAKKVGDAIVAHEGARFVADNGSKLRLHPRTVKATHFGIVYKQNFDGTEEPHGLRASVTLEVVPDPEADDEEPQPRYVTLDVPLD